MLKLQNKDKLFNGEGGRKMADYSKRYTVEEDQVLDCLKETMMQKSQAYKRYVDGKKEMENCQLKISYNDEKYIEKHAIIPLQKIPYPDVESKKVDSNIDVLLKSQVHYFWFVPITFSMLDIYFKYNNANPKMVWITFILFVISFIVTICVEILWCKFLIERNENYIKNIKEQKKKMKLYAG